MAKKAALKPVNKSKQNFLQSSWLPGALLVIAVVFAYQPVWHAGFIWDDDKYVTNNPLLTAPDGLWRIWFTTDSPSQYFPLTYTVFRIEHALWGFNSTGYHLVNILLHAINSLLLWQLLKRLVIPGAWLAAAIFALHPVQVESVAWVTELKNVLMCFFFLQTLRCWTEFIETAKWKFYALAIILFALALCAKTTACTLPVALLLILWLKKTPINFQRLLQLVPFVAMAIGMGLLTMWWERNHQNTKILTPLGLDERIIVASHAIWFYIGKLFWPVDLTFSYPKWEIHPNQPSNYLWLAALVVLAAIICFTRRFAGRSIETALLFFVATLMPTLGFIMLYTFRMTYVADHYQYVACIGLIALSATGIVLALNKNYLLKIFVSAILLSSLAVSTWRQCRMYSNLETLWRTTAERNPSSWMADNNLGNVLLEKGKPDEAIAFIQKALAIQPDYPEAEVSLGNALSDKGQLDEAIIHYQKALKTAPTYADACYDLGTALLQKGKMDDAIVQFQKTLALRKNDAKAHYNLGLAFLQIEKFDDAIIQFQETLALRPEDARARGNLGVAFFQKGQILQAVACYQETLRLNPNDAGTCFNLSQALFRLKQTPEAITSAQHALQLAKAQNDMTLAATIESSIKTYQQ